MFQMELDVRIFDFSFVMLVDLPFFISSSLVSICFLDDLWLISSRTPSFYCLDTYHILLVQKLFYWCFLFLGAGDEEKPKKEAIYMALNDDSDSSELLISLALSAVTKI
jgi:hypothetical protein